MIVPVYNAREYLPLSLPSIMAAAQSYGPADIILVDNGSDDGSMDYLDALIDNRVRVLELPEGNVGAVRNLGSVHARGGLLSFIDADCTVPSDYFIQALAVLRRTEADATGSPYVVPAEAGTMERTWWKLHAPSGERWVHYLNAGNFFCKADVFHSVGGFDPRLESGEDAELGLRLSHQGYKILSSPSVRATHHGNPKTLLAFFRKQIWHGSGALGTFRQNRLDRPLIMTVGHVTLTVVGLIIGFLQGFFEGIAVAGVATFAVPTLTVAFRMHQVRRPFNPFMAVLLYWLYYTGRATALGLLMVRRVRLRWIRGVPSKEGDRSGDLRP